MGLVGHVARNPRLVGRHIAYIPSVPYKVVKRLLRLLVALKDLILSLQGIAKGSA